jgi:hypothetical protein
VAAGAQTNHRHHPRGRPDRHLHARLLRHRSALLGAGFAGALLAVVGPGILAGLSDRRPGGITTYSILGAKYGYDLPGSWRSRPPP